VRAPAVGPARAYSSAYRDINVMFARRIPARQWKDYQISECVTVAGPSRIAS
jgi:hypothetical protein